MIPPSSRPPPGYLRTCDWLDARVGRLVAAGTPPRFALPPPGVALVGDLGDVGALFARDAAARELVADCRALVGGDRPTLLMLAVVLDRRELPVERLTTSELGALLERAGRPS